MSEFYVNAERSVMCNDINVVVGSEILSLSLEPENSIYLFSALRVVRELFVSCRENGKKTFLTNITMIVRGLLFVMHKYINNY